MKKILLSLIGIGSLMSAIIVPSVIHHQQIQEKRNKINKLQEFLPKLEKSVVGKHIVTCVENFKNPDNFSLCLKK